MLSHLKTVDLNLIEISHLQMYFVLRPWLRIVPQGGRIVHCEFWTKNCELWTWNWELWIQNTWVHHPRTSFCWFIVRYDPIHENCAPGWKNIGFNSLEVRTIAKCSSLNQIEKEILQIDFSRNCCTPVNRWFKVIFYPFNTKQFFFQFEKEKKQKFK